MRISAEIPIQTLCPCSKEISAYGAHNQRALAKLEIRSAEMVWLEELAAIADAGASAPVYGLLKRPDEKFVTEQAYDNPRFVEDAVREIALRLEADKRIIWYKATVESIESIHNHNAFCLCRKGLEGRGDMILKLEPQTLANEFSQLGIHPASEAIFLHKSEIVPLKILDIRTPAANIIKQEMLACGGDCAIPAGCVVCAEERVDVILLGTYKHYTRLLEKLTQMPYFGMAG